MGTLEILFRTDRMKFLIALVVVSVVSVNAGEDWKMFMKWAKTKAMESCWGEENMKLHTLNMKKAVSKCLQVDAPETELPPFRYLNRFTNNLVSMANNNQRYGQSHNNEDEVVKMMKMMMMMKMMKSFGGEDESHHSSFIKTFQFSIRMTTFDLLQERSGYIAFLVTDEYLRTKEHNDSTLLYLIDGVTSSPC